MSLKPFLEFAVGTSLPVEIQLTNDGEPMVGTGWDLTHDIKQLVNREMVDIEGAPLTVVWADQAAGIARVTGRENLEAGNYLFVFILTDGTGKTESVPNYPPSLTLGFIGHYWKVTQWPGQAEAS
jgi:hypothetical protein